MKMFVMDLVEFWKNYWRMVGEFYKKHWCGTIIAVVVIYALAFICCGGSYLISYIRHEKRCRKEESEEEE